MRFAPLPSVNAPHDGAAPYMRSVGGDELNVCVDLAVLNKGALTPETTPQVRVGVVLAAVVVGSGLELGMSPALGFWRDMLANSHPYMHARMHTRTHACLFVCLSFRAGRGCRRGDGAQSRPTFRPSNQTFNQPSNRPTFQPFNVLETFLNRSLILFLIRFFDLFFIFRIFEKQQKHVFLDEFMFSLIFDLEWYFRVQEYQNRTQHEKIPLGSYP